MSDTMENVKTINSVVRTGLLALIIGALGYAGWFTYSNYIGPSHKAKKALADLEQATADLNELKVAYDSQQVKLSETKEELKVTKIQKERLETSLKLLKVDRRLANLSVTKVGKNEEDQPYFDVSFVEVDSYGEPVTPPREFRLKGDTVHVDCLVCKFEDQYVEQEDELRNASLCIFNKIYGNLDGLDGGYSLDRADESGNVSAPGIYHSGAGMTEFEEQIWGDFWEIANDRERQEELGIRANHGEVTYLKVREGKVYQVEVRASGGMALRPLPGVPAMPRDTE